MHYYVVVTALIVLIFLCIAVLNRRNLTVKGGFSNRDSDAINIWDVDDVPTQISRSILLEVLERLAANVKQFDDLDALLEHLRTLGAPIDPINPASEDPIAGEAVRIARRGDMNDGYETPPSEEDTSNMLEDALARRKTKIVQAKAALRALIEKIKNGEVPRQRIALSKFVYLRKLPRDQDRSDYMPPVKRVFPAVDGCRATADGCLRVADSQDHNPALDSAVAEPKFSGRLGV